MYIGVAISRIQSVDQGGTVLVAVILEVKSGPFAGRKIPLPGGQTLLIGRIPGRSNFAVPDDNRMSGVHFAVECGLCGCRVIDKKSSNGTFLNGARIQEAMLATSDEITSGQTVFVVRIVPDEQLRANSSSPQSATASPPVVPREIPTPAPAPARPAVIPAPSPGRTYKMPEAPAPSPAVQDRHAA